MFDPRKVYQNDRRFSHKAQIIQKRPVTSEENARRPVHPSDLLRAKVVMSTYGYKWFAFMPVLHIEMRPKSDLAPLYVDPYDTYIKDVNSQYWTINNPEYYKGTYSTIIFLRAYNCIVNYQTDLAPTLFYLTEAYFCVRKSMDNLPGYGRFATQSKFQESSNMDSFNYYCPYTDTTYSTYRLLQSSQGGDYPTVVEAIAIL